MYRTEKHNTSRFVARFAFLALYQTDSTPNLILPHFSLCLLFPRMRREINVFIRATLQSRGALFILALLVGLIYHSAPAQSRSIKHTDKESPGMREPGERSRFLHIAYRVSCPFGIMQAPALILHPNKINARARRSASKS